MKRDSIKSKGIKIMSSLCMALALTGTSVHAAELVEFENIDAINTVVSDHDIVSGGQEDIDAALLQADEADTEAADESSAENPEVVHDATDIASGRDKDISWVIDVNGKLTIEGKGDFSEEFYALNNPSIAWRPYASQITSAEINVSGMTNTTRLFYYCSSLTSIDFSSFDTSNVVNMESMFYGCAGLTDLDLSSLNTSNVVNMRTMFYGCNGLKNLNLSSFDTSSVEDMSSMFLDCNTMTSLDLSSFDTSNVKDMRFMFSNCKALTSLNLSSFDTSKVTSMQQMFFECNSLTELNVSSFNVANVVDMGSMFQGCSSLVSLDLSSFKDSKNVTNMADMFYWCTNLANLNLSTLDTGNVTDMRWMFYGCSSLANLDLSSFSTGNVKDMTFMFNRCSGLTSLDLSSFDISNTPDLESMFEGCSGLTSLNISSFDTSNVVSMVSLFADCSSLTGLDLSSFNTANVQYMQGMFRGCNSLTSLDLSSLDTGNVEDMTEMFCRCSSLTSLDLSTLKTAKVKNMTSMFYGCKGLTSLDFSLFNTSNATYMYGMFGGCTGLTSLDLSSFDTGNVTDMQFMFSNCSSLKSLNLSSFDTGNALKMDNMFDECAGLMTIETPKAMGSTSIVLPAVFVDKKGTKTQTLNQEFCNNTLTRTVQQIAAPTITVSGNKVIITSVVAGSTIYYTTDGSVPTLTNGKKAEGPSVTIDTFSGTVKAIAVKSGYSDSPMARKVLLNSKKTRNVSFAVKGVFGGRNVTFGSQVKGAKVYYSPTKSTLTTKDKCVNAGDTVLFENFYGTIYARTFYNGEWGNPCRLILKIPVVNTPTVSVDSKGYATIRTTTPGTRIYYTTDGSTPSMTNGKMVSSPYVRVYVGKGKTVKAIAVRSCFTHSKVGTGK